MSIATKKILLVCLTLSLLALAPDLSFANAQGACSWHGGVNCAAGPDWDSSEVCNDGWRGSTVNYWTTVECKQYLCTKQIILREALIKKAEEKGGTLDPERTRSKLFEALGLYGYESLEQDAQQRLAEIEMVFDQINSTVDSVRFTCWNNETTTTKQLPCTDTINGYLGSDDKCYCDTGFTWSDSEDKCVVFNACPFENSYLSNNLCYCNQDYQWNNDQTACVKTTLNITPQPGPEIEHTQKIKSKPQSQHTQVFTDVDNSPNFDAILFLNSRGIIKGYDDKTFRPNNTVNRAELVKILVTGKGMTPSIEEYKNCFSDVTIDWFAPYICYAKSKYWISGYQDGTFKPNQTVNKAEAIKMLLNSQSVGFATKVESKPFNDVEVTDWFAPYIKRAKELGILEETGNIFSPAEGMSRSGIAENLYRLIK